MTSRGAAASLTGLALALALGGCVVPLGVEDTQEANDIEDALLERYTFSVKSKWVPARPALAAIPSTKRTLVVINGLTDRAEQDKVIELLREIRATIATKPIVVEFYRDEVVTEWTDPATGHRRAHKDNVDLLRSVRLP